MPLVADIGLSLTYNPQKHRELVFGKIQKPGKLFFLTSSFMEERDVTASRCKGCSNDQDAALTMSRIERRRFQAQVVMDHCDDNTSLEKTVFSWDQETTRKVLLERESGTTISDKPRKSRPTFSEKHWWRYRKGNYRHIERLQIDLDNGPGLESCRTQFIKRIVEFSDKTKLSIELVYYPPYHSKYNPIEHCWGVLERHWNGTLLTDWETVRRWTRSMRWDGLEPNVIYRPRICPWRQTDKEGNETLLTTTRPYIEQWNLFISPS